MSDTCQEHVYMGSRDVSGHRCGRPFKTDEQREAQLCGIHLAGLKRRRANDDVHDEWKAAQDAAHDRANVLCAQLSDLGVKASPEYLVGLRVRSGGYTGGVVIGSEQTAALIARLEGEAS